VDALSWKCFSCKATITAMKTIHGICAGLLGLLASTTTLHAADCDSLKQLSLPDTTITLAEQVTSGDLSGPGIDKPLHDLPPFCRVTGILHPTADSEIRFEVWLPEKDWNQRLLGVGNGGFAGSIWYSQLAGNLKRGFATAGSDAGHQAEGEDASWAFGHPEKIKDFGWRAVHLTAERAKDVIKAYYGKTASKAYFDSCSDGGREALMEAQRFPEDYDGILAGAPANAWSHMLTSGVGLAQSTIGDPRGYISSYKLPAIQKAALAACDASDGVKDGFLNDPEKCHFDPAVLLCKGADSLDCLTQPQVNSLKAYYAGTSLFPGYAMGDEDSWGSWVVGQGPGSGSGLQYVQNYFRYMVTEDPKWNTLTADVSASLEQATQKTAAALDSTNPDLSRFRARGGKLIMYHGWNDPAISPWNSIAYYKQVQKTVGEKETAGFMQLYMVPGMEHCAGGPGPAAFGQLGIATSGVPKYGAFDALVDWVEKDVPSEKIIATKFSSDSKVLMTRPLCPYPQLAKYKGTGDTNDAANFVCSKP
jgi:Tannase and feruloyl esterase